MKKITVDSLTHKQMVELVNYVTSPDNMIGKYPVISCDTGGIACFDPNSTDDDQRYKDISFSLNSQYAGISKRIAIGDLEEIEEIFTGLTKILVKYITD